MKNTPDQGEDVEVVDTNSGGRVYFAVGTPVRILQLDGSISTETYQVINPSGGAPPATGAVKPIRSDRKGLVNLREIGGTREVKVLHRRVLPVSINGHAVVVESGDKFWALCPKCGSVAEVSTSDTSITCSKCSTPRRSATFPLHWLGVKPMSDVAEKKKKDKAPAKAANTAPKPDKSPRTVKEPTKIDLNSLAKTKQCELWTKKNVKFDHVRIDVMAHVLLYTGDNPRKLCFNTYNETLGKKVTELPLDAFLANNKHKADFFVVADLDKERLKLQKNGYTRH